MKVSISELVRRDLLSRERTEIQSFGSAVQQYTGPTAILDAYDEALSLVIYLRQVIEELTISGKPFPTPLPPLDSLLLPTEDLK